MLPQMSARIGYRERGIVPERRRFARGMLVTVLVMFAILAALVGAVICNARF
jgi:hypothetical protein